MLDLLFRAFFAALLVAFLIPLLVSSPQSAGFASTNATIPARRHGRRRAGGANLRDKWAADQFAFERAIEAYEELIDRTAGTLP
jgi:hypothetical protein